VDSGAGCCSIQALVATGALPRENVFGKGAKGAKGARAYAIGTGIEIRAAREESGQGRSISSVAGSKELEILCALAPSGLVFEYACACTSVHVCRFKCNRNNIAVLAKVFLYDSANPIRIFHVHFSLLEYTPQFEPQWSFWAHTF